ncbi:MAG: 1-acyl-sn-glycerol-3-phosphate acyltransferase [Pseudomonadota bacterium]
MIRSTVFNVLFYGFTFLIAMTIWVMSFFASRNAIWYVLRFWGKANLVLLRVILGGKVEVRGREHLKLDRPQVIVAKHQSELDIVMLAVLLWDISAVAMAELTKLPFFGRILRKLEIVLIAVDSGPQGRTQQAIDGAKRMKKQERTMVIYPEGELMKLGAKERYRRGAAHIYGAMEVEAVPVAVSLGVIWPQRQWRKNIGKTGAIEFMEPILPGMDPEAFLAEVETRIETRTMDLIEEHASGQMLEDARDRYRRGANNEPDAT